MPEQDKKPFYVGYLPMPKAIRKFIVPWFAANLVLALGIAAVIAQQHRAPGDGVWETGEAVTLNGLLTHEPYPLVRVFDSNDEVTTYILVQQGKLGASELVQDIGDWQPIAAQGYFIERAGRKVFELDSTLSDPIVQSAVVDLNPDAISQPESLGTHTLRGEIVDPKCYLGVMQPGDGKTHKVCATLCIKGGIPPMLLVKNNSGDTAAYLLTDARGNAFPESHHEYIADPIEVTGRVLRDGDLLWFRADLSTIKRLDSAR